MAQFPLVTVVVEVAIVMLEDKEITPHLQIQLGPQPILSGVVEEEDLEIAIFPIKTQVLQLHQLVEAVVVEDKEMVMHLLH